jgi:hypothetical protein
MAYLVFHPGKQVVAGSVDGDRFQKLLSSITILLSGLPKLGRVTNDLLLALQAPEQGLHKIYLVRFG